MSDIRERIKRMSSHMKVEGIAEFLNTTPEEVQRILDGEKIEINELKKDNQSIVQVTTNIVVHGQKVVSVWRAKGGVGATTLAINLAKMVSDRMKTLLICLNFFEGGSDLIHYLDLPYFPLSARVLKENMLHYTEIQNNFFVLHPLTKLDEAIATEDIRNLIMKARQDFDCIILDLPAGMESAALEAASNSNLIVFVLQGGQQEAQRIARLSYTYHKKEQVFVVSGGATASDLNDIVQAEKIYELPFDKTLRERLEKRSPYLPNNSPYYQALESIYHGIFGDKPELIKTSTFKKFTQNLKIRRKFGNFLYGFRLWDIAKDSFYLATCAVVLIAALYQLKVPFATEAVNMLIERFFKA